MNSVKFSLYIPFVEAEGSPATVRVTILNSPQIVWPDVEVGAGGCVRDARQHPEGAVVELRVQTLGRLRPHPPVTGHQGPGKILSFMSVKNILRELLLYII